MVHQVAECLPGPSWQLASVSSHYAFAPAARNGAEEQRREGEAQPHTVHCEHAVGTREQPREREPKCFVTMPLQD